MPSRRAVLGWAGGVAGVAACAAALPVLSLPPARDLGAPPSPVDPAEHARTLALMRPPKRQRPLLAVLAANGGTETTDLLVPHGVLARSGVAEVVLVAERDAPVALMPALAVAPQATIAAFEARHPEGADYVIVPAMHAPSPALVDWARAQAGRGAVIVGVCSGVKLLGMAGLLEGRAATGHWFDLSALQRAYPSMRWVRDRRYVADRGVVTTTGVSASVPVSLALVEAIAGRETAAALASTLGTPTWDARHDSSAFRLDRGHVLAAAANRLSPWRHEILVLPAKAGADEIALALAADAWSRTWRSRVLLRSEDGGPVATCGGLSLLPDRDRGVLPELASVLPAGARPLQALDAALDGIRDRYGASTARFVALQLEQRWPAQHERAL